MSSRSHVAAAAWLLMAITLPADCQVGMLCRPEEMLLSCGGCQGTCEQPAPPCPNTCHIGCYCPHDWLRNSTGHCVPPHLCLAEATSQPSGEYSVADRIARAPSVPNCGPLEEFRECEPCNRTCDNPNPVCPAQCARGCFCRDGLLRDRDGSCVPPRRCSMKPYTAPSQSVAVVITVEDCGASEEYFICGWCEPKCKDPEPVCSSVSCVAGCQCKLPLLRDSKGRCVHYNDCFQSGEEQEAVPLMVSRWRPKMARPRQLPAAQAPRARHLSQRDAHHTLVFAPINYMPIFHFNSPRKIYNKKMVYNSHG